MTPRIHPLYPGNYIIIKLNPEFKVVSIYLSQSVIPFCILLVVSYIFLSTIKATLISDH